MPDEGVHILDLIRERARTKNHKVVLPEAEEPRVIDAAGKMVKEKIAQVNLLEKKENITGLAFIAVSTAQIHKNLTDEKPKVAVLSFSTKGSPSHPDVDKVTEALSIIKKNHRELKVDGELQVDAAIIPEIARKKNLGSIIECDANVLIFPDLDTGNIAYKLTQRLANTSATGPIVQHLKLPANDLSQSCSSDDIVDVTAIAMLMKG